MSSVRDTFCIYHVTAPGQEPGAEDLPEGQAYPTMDELSEQVCHHLLLITIHISTRLGSLNWVITVWLRSTTEFFSSCVIIIPI